MGPEKTLRTEGGAARVGKERKMYGGVTKFLM